MKLHPLETFGFIGWAVSLVLWLATDSVASLVMCGIAAICLLTGQQIRHAKDRP